jgi:hypothetical protein
MFSEFVQECIGYYVYRLIDPRNGATFYVGKGVGNRVFHHVSEADKNLDIDTHKLGKIREIKADGLDVAYVIHRHGLSEKEAFEVEAALIDAYENLSNRQIGLHSDDRGAMTANEVVSLYETTPATIKEPVVLINIRREWFRGVPPDQLYERTRQYWYCNPERHHAMYAMAVRTGVIGRFTGFAGGTRSTWIGFRLIRPEGHRPRG